MTKKRLLFVSNLFPNPLEPQRGTFNQQQVAALKKFYHIDIVAPVAWTLCERKAGIPSKREFDGSAVYHPTYWYTPGLCRSWYGRFFLRSIQKVVLEAHKANPFDAVFASWLYPDGWAAGKLAQIMGVPFFVKVHGTDVNRLKCGTLMTKVSIEGIGGAERIFSVSGALKSHLMSLGVLERKIKVIYNGVDQKIFYPRPKDTARQSVGVDGQSQIILFVGNLKKEKGLGELAAAFSKLINSGGERDYRLVIVGRGPYEGELKKQLENLGVINQVQFKGSLPPEKVAMWMNAASVLCLPSYMEGVPNVILEALSCEVPVVATDVGGIPELSVKSGLLQMVAPKDIDGLIRELKFVLEEDLEEAKCNGLPTWLENAQQVRDVIDSFVF
ncbi:hypothetical protein A7E78_00345 [Syntrophotalea acetylenivorans]|uniref:Glycosyltransferase family 4 protein n=1 Tax=Syntrophotalea acetylenivorans TaxID=1842532 RepID=A0A1L3GKJ9_9BACT|nr:glycosyltransferase [Syntrophotalea acetylenivorans]APG26449.1 hypothetical protein A7E78_00345 [Syntrophotalea acetylenivorans]